MNQKIFKNETNILVLFYLYMINRIFRDQESILALYFINWITVGPALIDAGYSSEPLNQVDPDCGNADKNDRKTPNLQDGLYYFNARWYDPNLGRFTTEDPIRDGLNWYIYANNNPINRIDPNGLEDIVIFSAIDRWNNANNIGYNILVHDSYRQIRKTAEAEGLTVRIVNGSDATADRLNNELQDIETQRLVVVAHGDSGGTFYDVDGVKINFQSYDKSTTGSNLQTIDLVGCYGDQGEDTWNEKTGVSDVRSYNPTIPDSSPIWWNQTNETLDTKIPESIATGTNNSGSPNVEPDPITYTLFGSGSEGVGGTDELKNK